MIKKLFKQGVVLSALLTSTSVLADTQWRTVDADKLMVMSLPHGKVVFELTPQFAPNHVKHFTELAAKGHYDGNSFYRVIDGFVAQAGPEEDENAEVKAKTLIIESEWPLDKSAPITPVQSPDLFAENTGFIDGFAVASDSSEKKVWLTHCPGVLAMARGNEANSATSHFYITNGQAPRYLDRIMTVFGRVVYGMEHVQAIQRTSVVEGNTPVEAKDFTPITGMQLMSSLPKSEQLTIQIEDTNSKAFIDKVADRRARPHAFFFKKPPPVLDVCQVPVKTRIVP